MLAGGQGRWTDERGEEAGTRGGGLLGLTERPPRKFGRLYIHIDYTSTTTVSHNETHDRVPLRICIRWIKFKGGVHCVSKGVPRRMISFRNGER